MMNPVGKGHLDFLGKNKEKVQKNFVIISRAHKKQIDLNARLNARIQLTQERHKPIKTISKISLKLVAKC